MNYRKIIAKTLLFFLMLQLVSGLFPSPINTAIALDTDGTANLDMTVTSIVEEESIVGTNFSVSLSLSNALSSESDAFNPGFIVKLPEDVVFISSAGLGAPVRIELLADGSTLLFFETDGFIPQGTSEDYSLNLSSNVAADLFTPTDIEVLAYAEDNIYGAGSVPTGSPSGTLPGGYDYANSSIDPATSDFPNYIDSNTDLTSLPFVATTTQFIPFNIEKIGTDELLLGEVGTTTLRITGNDLGPLDDFEIVDVIPNTQKFVGFTSLGGATTSVAYDTPSAGQVTLTISNIDVPTGGIVNIQYETLALTHEASSYSGTTVVLNTAAPVTDQTISTNIASHQVAGSWFDGNGVVSVNSGTVIIPREVDSALSFGELSKSVNNLNPVIGNTIIYTVTYDVAQNIAYDSSNLGTYIEDTLPDGLSFISEISSVNSGAGDALSLTANSTNADGDTTLVWSLGGGDTIEPGDFLTIRYSVLVDAIYEGVGDIQYENTQSIVNNAQFRGNIIDSGNNEEWGFTDPSIIGTQDTDEASATITAPNPTNNKQLIRVEFPDGTIYDSGNPMPVGVSIPVGSRLDFNASMIFPNVYSNSAKLIDALPLVTGPNTATYGISFQLNNALFDINGDPVVINDDNNDGVPDSIINGLSLGGVTPSSTSWIDTTPANNLEFNIGGGTSAKTFSINFSVDVLPIAPSGGASASLPIKNVLLGTFNDDAGTLNTLGLIKEPFVLGFPIIEMEKSVIPDPTADIAFGDSVTYQVVIENTGEAKGYLEKIIDTFPDNMTLDSGYTIVYSGSLASPVPGASIIQSGSTLEIRFDVDPTLGRSQLAVDNITTTDIGESVVIINYSLSPTVNFVIVGGEVRTNIITLDYYSSGDAASNEVNKIDELEVEAEFSVAAPTITRTYFSTSETDSPTNGGGGRPDIHAGEETVFETTITLPGGTYTDSRFTENLLTSRLTFLSGEVISSGPNLTFSTGTGFTNNLINFGDIVNTGTGDQDIIIHTTAIGRNDVTRRNNVRARGDFRYSGETITINTPVDLIIPTLNILKSVDPVFVDTDDIFTYIIEIEHTSPSNARAYDIILKDLLPGNVDYIVGTLSGNTNFIGTEADLFSGSGILLPDLADGSTETLTFDAEVGTGAIATQNETNFVTIDYSTLDDDGSPVEANFSATGSVDITIKAIEIVHYISSTSNSDTSTGAFTTAYEDLTIGEEVTYTIEIDVPELLFSGVTLTQTLPAGIEFLTGFTLTNGVTSHTIDTFTINPDGSVTFDFGDIDNTSAGSGTGFMLQTTAVVTDIVGNNAGDTVNSVILLEYDTDSSSTDNSPNFDIVEPNLSITKVYSPDSGDGGDSIPTTITIENTGTSPLYDISWIDTLPPKSTGAAGYLAISSTGVLLPGESIIYTYNTILDNTVVYGEMLTGTASITGDSIPGVVTEERDYTATASDIITIIGITGLQKDLTSSGLATIGDIETYIIRVPISEGVTSNVSVADLIPVGMEIIPGSVNITSSGSVSYSGTVIPTIGTVSLGATQSVDYVFTNINNSNSDNSVTEYIEISYSVVVLNTSDNNAGDSRAEDVTANYNSGSTILDDGPVPVDIVEPSVGIDLISTYTYGNEVLYTYTITNTGSSTAYDLDIDTILPTGLTYSGAITITNSGGVVGIIQAGEDFNIEELPVNTGSPLQFTIAGVINPTVADMTSLTAEADITYTGQDDTYTSVVTNTDNTERTGTNVGVNDYLDTDPETITVLLPILNEEISIVDINGGVGIIGDVFEYTITLTNSGSVDLTDISALLNISGSFTGFTIISTPSGSTDSSTGSGGVNGAGQVNIEDIDLLIGQSITIVYQVTALDTIPSGTTVNSEVTVSDSPEGAIGGTPNVDVTILAPAVQLTKSIASTSFSSPVVPNDAITYQLLAENTGDVALYNVIINDNMLGGNITANCSFPGTGGILAPTEIATCDPSNYVLTESDIIRGYVENSAEVNSEDESMNPVNDISDSGIGNENIETLSGTGGTDADTTNDPTVQTLVQNPELRVTKVITGTGFNIPNLVGDTISYEIIVENVGNLNITDITVSDVLLGGDITSFCTFPISASGGLNIGQSATCIPNDYVIGIPDIIRGYVDNNAVATGTDSLDDEVRDTSDPGDENTETPSGDGLTTDSDSTNDPTTVPLIGEAELTLTKLISTDTLSTPTASGDTITYSITILNSGQLPVNNVTVDDVLLGGDITSSCAFPISASNGLEVGESATCSPDAYIVQESDIVRGYIDNNAIVDAFDPNSDPVDDVSDPGDENTETPSGDGTTTDGDSTNDPTFRGLIQSPSWSITKSSIATPVKVGETIDYVFKVENTGNISINIPNLTDQKCSTGPTLVANTDIASDSLISPNEIWDYTCKSIPITQTEVDDGAVDNTISASGSTVLGNLPNITDSLKLEVAPTPEWKVEKSALSTPLKAEDTIIYQFLVTNTGNVSISNIIVTDNKCGAIPTFDTSSDINSDEKLFQDEVWRYTCESIPVTQEEADDKQVLNTVSVAGTSASGSLANTNDSISTPVGPTPNWTLSKTTDSTPSFSGETLEYDFSIYNSGNVTISDITLTDEKCSALPILVVSTDINSDGKISPEETWKYTCTSIAVTQAEVDTGLVNNVASATGTPAQGTLNDAEAELDTGIVPTPKLQLYKTDALIVSATPRLGSIIDYTFTIENTGNVTISEMILNDAKLGGDITSSCVFPTDSATGLLPNETATCELRYQITENDVALGYAENSATVQGKDPKTGNVVDISDDGNDAMETANGQNIFDTDPTNDPTVLIIPERTNSGGGGGGSTSSGGLTSVTAPTEEAEEGDPIVETPVGEGNEITVNSQENSDKTPEQTPEQEESENVPFDMTNTLKSAKVVLDKHEEKVQLLERLREEAQLQGESLLKGFPAVLPKTGTPIFERVKTVASPYVTTELPDQSVFRLAGSTNSELDYWTQVLVDEDKNKSKYIVIPSNGMVMPINGFSENSEDFTSMINGREANINKPLETGALEYPGSSTKGYGEVGNKVVFAHSSHFGSSLGRYKTHFQKIIELDQGEEIWIYEKQSDGSFKRFVYVTEKSYNTPANDTSVLQPGLGKNLTLFTCTPIGGIEGRWIIKAKYYDEILPQLEREVYFKDVSSVYKTRIEKFNRNVLQFNVADQGEVFGRIFENTQTLQKSYDSKNYIYRILEYLRFRIAQSLYGGEE